MSGISGSVRDLIVKRVIKHRFEKELEQAKKARGEAGEKLYHHLMGPDALVMIQLPEGWMPKKESIRCSLRRHGNAYRSHEPWHAGYLRQS